MLPLSRSRPPVLVQALPRGKPQSLGWIGLDYALRRTSSGDTGDSVVRTDATLAAGPLLGRRLSGRYQPSTRIQPEWKAAATVALP